MAETFTTSKVATTVMARGGIGVQSVHGTYELTKALVVNDVIQMVKIPKGARIIDTILAADDLDTGSPAIVLTVGDGTTADRFITASTVAQGSGVARLGQVDGLGYVYTAEDTIDVKVTTAPATGTATGTIALTVLYDMQQA